MAAIVAGNSLGLSLTSLSTLGQNGSEGAPTAGRRGEQISERVYVNAVTGNLVVQGQDEFIASRGSDLSVVRTYNSRGKFNAGVQDAWAVGSTRQRIVGPLHAGPGTIIRADHDGAEATYTWDAARALYITTAGGGAHDSVGWDSALSQFVWRDGSTGLVERYDQAGRLVKTLDADSNAVTYAYNAQGRLESMNAANGEVLTYKYNASGDLSEITASASGSATFTTRTSYSYDSARRLSDVRVDLTPADATDSKSWVTHYDYVDASSQRLLMITQGDGSTLAFGYGAVDASGYAKVTSITDGLGRTTNYDYSVANQTTVTDAAGSLTVFRYDAAGQLKQIDKGGLLERAFEYDTLTGDLTKVTHGDGSYAQYRYDAFGNLTQQWDTGGNSLARTYTAGNQLESETVYHAADADKAQAASQPGAGTTTRYIYKADAPQRLAFVVTAQGRVTQHTYNAYGERTRTQSFDATYAGSMTEPALLAWSAAQPAAGITRTDRSYDERGQLWKETTYGTTGDAATQATAIYTYNAQGQLLTVTDGSGVAFSYSYDGLGRQKTATDALGRSTITDYDDAGATTSVTQANGLSTTSAWDRAGNLITVSTRLQGVALGVKRYTWDAANRLVMTTDETGVRSFILYDAQGRQQATIDGDGSFTEYFYDRADRLTRSLTYSTAAVLSRLVDASGNWLNASIATVRPAAASTTDRSQWRAYDSAGRLSKMVDAQGAVTQYDYDGASQLMATRRYASTIVTTALGNTPPASAIAPVANAADDRITRNFYDNDGLLIASLDAEGYLQTHAYDGTGLLVQTTRYANQTLASDRATGQLATLIASADDGAGHQLTTWLRDGSGRVEGEIDAQGYLTRTTYDMAGRVLAQMRYENKVTAPFTPASSVQTLVPVAGTQDRKTLFEYNQVGQLKKEIDYQGTITTHDYDGMGNRTLTLRAVNTWQETRATLANQYDERGRLICELTGEGYAAMQLAATPAQAQAIALQHSRVHAYDDADRRTSTTDPNGQRTLYFYDADGRLTHTVNATGAVVESVYNALGDKTAGIRYATGISAANLALLTGAKAGGLVNTTLTTAIASIRDSGKDWRVDYTYDKAGGLDKKQDASASITDYTLNAFGEEIERIDPLGTAGTRVVSTTRDRRGFATRTTEDASGLNRKRETSYDAFGRIDRAVDGTNAASIVSYDRLGRQVSVTGPLQADTSTSYDAFGRVLTQTDALQKITGYSYDTASRTITVTTPEGLQLVTTQDRHGQAASVRDARGITTTYAYDMDGRLEATTRDGVTTSRTYDRAGRLLTETDGNAKIVTITYDDANRKWTRTVDAGAGGLALATSYTADAQGRQISVTEPNGALTQYAYNKDGQLQSMTVDAAAGGLALKTQYAYDPQGNVVSVTDPMGSRTDYVFDKLGRRIAQTVDAGTAQGKLNLTTRYSYDANDNVVSVTDANNVTSYRIDDANNRPIYTIDGAGNVQASEYDAAGRLTKTIRYARPVTGVGATTTALQLAGKLVADPDDQTLYRVHDNDGRLTATATGAGEVVRYVYDGNGNVVERRAYANALVGWTPGCPVNLVSDDARDLRERKLYDSFNRVTYSIDGTGAVVTFKYDKAGNVTERLAYATTIAPSSFTGTTAVLPTTSTSDQKVMNVYDGANRPTHSADGTGAVTRRIYDRNGNVIQQAAYSRRIAPGASPALVIATAGMDRLTNYVYDKANRLTHTMNAAGAVVQNILDANGNITQRIQRNKTATPTGAGVTLTAITVSADAANDRIARMAWDGANRLVMAVDGTGAATETVYDGVGNVRTSIRYENPITDYGTIGTTPLPAALKSKIPTPLAQRATSYSYDNANRLKTTTDALGQVESYEYDGVGNRKSFSNAKGATWSYDYDASGRMTEERSPSVDVAVLSETSFVSPTPTVLRTTFEYDALGNLFARKEAAGRTEERVTRYEYDAAGRQVRTRFAPVAVYAQESDAALATNGQGQTVTRSELALTSLVSETWYDALGNAVANKDVAGKMAYKVYDAAGSEVYDVDAMSYVTQRVYNAFGEATSLKRLATAITSFGTATSITQAQLEARLVTDAANDRTLSTRYDNMGRVSTLTEEAAYIWDSEAAQYYNTSRLTTTTYNAFGETVQVARAKNISTGVVSEFSYYDAAGRLKASVNAGGFLTRYSYDAVGNLQEQTEYARAVSGATATSQPAAVIDTADRGTTYTYDKLNRKKSETRKAVEYTDPDTFAPGVGDVTTRYEYDALGNLVQQVAADNGITYTWYDALGRVTAIAQPARAGEDGSTALTPLTVYSRDAFGNVVMQTEHARGASSIAGAQPVANVDTANDRTTFTYLDAAGHATHTQDAQGNHRYASFDAHGRVAKEWQAVATTVGTTASSGLIFRAYQYDALGRLIKVSAPLSNTQLVDGKATIVSQSSITTVATTDFKYNAFGETVAKGVAGGTQEYFDYDRAGRLWRSNEGGIDKIFLYDRLGNRTAELSSAGYAYDNSDLKTAYTLATISSAASSTALRRIDMKYDALGRVKQQTLAQRAETYSDVAVRSANVTATVTAGGAYNSFSGWSAGSVTLAWSALANLGAGEVKAVVEYRARVANADGSISESTATRSAMSILTSEAGSTGAVIAIPLDNTAEGGVARITRVTVYKKSNFGVWVEVSNQSGPTAPTASHVIEVERVAGVISQSIEIKRSSTSAWEAMPATNGLWADFGDKYQLDLRGFDVAATQFRVLGKMANGTQTTLYTGSLANVTAQGYDGTSQKLRPVVNQSVDRWGNVTSISDVRNTAWVTKYDYNASNQMIRQYQPIEGAGGLYVSIATRHIHYDKMGRQVGMQDGNGNINRQRFDAQGNLAEEIHADGGRIVHRYNAFGERKETIDAMANRTTFAYNKVGLKTSVTHWARAIGAEPAMFEVYTAGRSGDSVTLTASTTASITETMEWDAAGRMLSQTNGAGEKTRYQYDLRGNVIRTTQNSGAVRETNAFDTQDRKIAETDGNNLTAKWSYDYFGRVTTRTDIGAAVYTYKYDAAKQLRSVTNTRGQNLTYGYDQAGQLNQVQDAALAKTTTYALDWAGNKIAEEVLQAGVVYQNNHMGYDSIGNLRWVGDTHSQVLMNYDLAGNRVSVFTHVINTDGLTETPNDTNRYFQYDKMNRQTVVDAIDAAGNINANQGHKLAYDLNGNRTTDTFYGRIVNKVYKNGDPEQFDYKASTALGQLTETYQYDALNRLTSIQRSDGHLFGQVDGEPDPQIDARKYDMASRVTQTGGADWLPANYLKELYGRDANGNAISGNGSRRRETCYNADGQQVVQVVKHNGGGIDYRQISDTFDGAGNLTAYRVLNSATNNYGVVMRALDGYREASVSGTSTAFEPGTSTSNYDANGHLRSVTQPGQVDRTYINDNNGQVLATMHGTKLMRQLIVNGEVLGQYGSGVDSATPRSATGEVVYDNNIAEFQLGYRSITPTYPLAAPGAYVVRSGDTLRSIAQQAYGDSRRWFQIADANGIQGDSDLRVGLTLNLPNLVGGAHNGAADFQPYDPSRMVGDTTPYMPPKPADKNVFGELLMIVVAIAMSVMLPGMAGAILGSLASQTVGIAAGVQEFYDLKQVAMAGLTAGVSMGMANLLPANSWLAGTGWGPAAARAAMASTITQGVATAVGWQKTISWKGIVATAGGAAVGNVVGNALGKAWGGSAGGNFAADVATRLAASGTAAVLRGGKVQVAQVVVDAFGNAVRGAAVEELQGQGPWSDANYRNGGDVQDDIVGETAAFHRLVAAGAAEQTAQRYAQQFREIYADPSEPVNFGRGSTTALTQQFRTPPSDTEQARAYAHVLAMPGRTVEDAWFIAKDVAHRQRLDVVGTTIAEMRIVEPNNPQIATLERQHRLGVLALVNRDVYFKNQINELLPNGIERVTSAIELARANLTPEALVDPRTGYFAALYHNQNDGSYIYANRGTDERKDWSHNFLQIAVGQSRQYAQALDNADFILQSAIGNRVTFTGHSLGGGLAAAQAFNTGIRGVTFNAAGLNPQTLGVAGLQRMMSNPELVQAHYVRGELLNTLQLDGPALGSTLLGTLGSPMSGAAAYAWLSKLPRAAGMQLAMNAVEQPTYNYRSNTWTPGATFTSRLPTTALALHSMTYVLNSVMQPMLKGKP
ncbi:LysM peptidoglycan-binding domain-containing protein [Caenimonas sp. SL110]|uniref:LysM peptidoglycan-binding domain-containing protein n=1 Tax=Caenimonas sp. SL110 TaxID=1450524 RepID=UPI000652A84F|nr:LysM peptidoglycan-binding domain-containing protein [Caenimonas sp. SL110]